MQARSQPSTAPQFQQGDKVLVVAKGLYLRYQQNRYKRQIVGTLYGVGEDWGK
jgi:hypothetical protein